MSERTRRVITPRRRPEFLDRLPPGQFAASRWPVFHHGDLPRIDLATWEFRVFGAVARPLVITWAEFQTLPRASVAADLHCVTRWTKLDNRWEGVALDVLANRAETSPEARFVMLHGVGGYTANLSREALTDTGALAAVAHDGEPLTPEHGFPVRAVVPGRYAWKSVKWLRAIEFLIDDRLGFWEGYGYHPNADVEREERFAGEAPDDRS